MAITKEEVLKIAHLSRISIHDNEIDSITQHLQDVLTYAACVNEVATSGQEALPQAINVFREDTVIPFDSERIKKQAPDIESDYFVVPAILEHE